ncbi:hypothetical protein K431DRAFT_286566 [Polychaeton citri CBS 116435]|uniref:Uncharacterized protein n=1 Tax=Polychaeton citri CBS 116435 TaxID=1314669 RepID=A0A9P4Q767_9PEZI|nr:hypothetical protein K431DRAFT_286566 [Polychaeton citri CBS 116435]
MAPPIHADARYNADETVSPTNTLHQPGNVPSRNAVSETGSHETLIGQRPGSISGGETIAGSVGAGEKDVYPKTTSSKDEPAPLNATRQPTVPDNISSDAAISQLDSPKSLNKTISQLQSVQATGPSNLFNPTNVRMHVRFHRHHDTDDVQTTPRPGDEFLLHWRSRDQRKGRNSSIASTEKRTSPLLSRVLSEATNIARGILVMIITFPYWNMAFWSGWSYTIGSILFVIDGAWSWGPVAFPSTEFGGEEEYGVPLCFFFGALFYQLGATVAYLEAINDGSFAGSAMRRFLEGHEEDKKRLLDEKLHNFFGHAKPHRRHKDGEEKQVDPEAGWENKESPPRSYSSFPNGMPPAPRRGGIDYGPSEEGQMTEYVVWRWWPTWKSLRTRHLFDLGYIACTIQLVGATMYAVAGVVILPGLLSSLNHTQSLFAYWIPQVVASVCFLTAGVMFTLETQEKWYRPTPQLLGWWIGAWATVGSVGFLLCAIFGIPSDTHTWCAYQSDLSSMWGSAAYLISSLLQWYEAVNKGAVLSFPNT